MAAHAHAARQRDSRRQLHARPVSPHPDARGEFVQNGDRLNGTRQLCRLTGGREQRDVFATGVITSAAGDALVRDDARRHRSLQQLPDFVGAVEVAACGPAGKRSWRCRGHN
jgi:hypothetical protein